MIIGVGTDITEVKRLRKAIEKWGDSFLARIFTKNELKTAKDRTSLYQHLAGRFAAKEAVFKALGEMHINFKDIEIWNDKEGKPYCKVVKSKKERDVDIHISISHVKEYATAFAVVTSKS